MAADKRRDRLCSGHNVGGSRCGMKEYVNGFCFVVFDQVLSVECHLFEHSSLTVLHRWTGVMVRVWRLQIRKGIRLSPVLQK